MDKESHIHNNHGNSNNNIASVRERDKSGGGDGGPGSLLLRGGTDGMRHSTTSDLVLQWGNRKRLRCMKVQVKHDSSSNPVQRTTVRVDRRVVRTEKDSSNRPLPLPSVANNNNNSSHQNNSFNQSNGYLNLRQRPPSPQQLPPRILRICVEVVDSCLPPNFVRGPTICDERQHVLADVSSKLKRSSRNSENSSAMRGGQSNGSVRGIASPDRGAHDKRGTHNNHLNDNNNKSVVSSDTAHDSKKGGGGSPSGSGDAAPPMWLPKFVIALTNKEKEEDFLLLKGSKLPQRPKKRVKFVQRTLNIVSPGTWLCDLTLDRYEVREKKITKKRPRGLKAMSNMDSDSE